MTNDITDPSRAARAIQAIQELRRVPWAMRPDALVALRDVLVSWGNGAALTIEAAPVLAARRAQAKSGPGAIAVLPISGRITPRDSFSLFSLLFGGTSVEWFRGVFRQAMADPEVGAIVLDVDSPGGMVDQIPEMAEEIRAARDRKPIVAAANTDAASAAYWLAAQASEVFVAPSGQAGSVGVYVLHADFSVFDANMGVKYTLISAGKYKTEGNEFEPLSEDAKTALQANVDAYYDMFVSGVAAGRGTDKQAVIDGYGQGRMVMAEDAVGQGMADHVGTLEDAIRRAASLAAAGGGTPASASAERVTVVADPEAADEPREQERTEAGAAAAAAAADPPAVAKAIPSHSTDTIDEPWDGPGEEAKISNDAGEKTLRKMYAWVDENADADTKAAYKLPHHKVTDGEPGPANENGCRNGLSRLPQSDVPEADHPGVQAHLNKHLDDAEAGAGESQSDAALLPGAERLLARPAVRDAFRPERVPEPTG